MVLLHAYYVDLLGFRRRQHRDSDNLAGKDRDLVSMYTL